MASAPEAPEAVTQPQESAYDVEPPAQDSAAEVEETPKVEAVSKPVIDSVLVEKAKALGLSQEDIQDHGDDKALSRTLKALEKVRAQAAKAPPVAQTQEQQAEAAKWYEFVLENEDQYDPVLVSKLKEMNKYNADRYGALESKLNAYEQDRVHEQQKEFVGWFDKTVDGMGEEYKALVSTRDGKQKILDEMDIIHYGLSQTGRKETRETIFKKAVALAFADKADEIATNKVRAQVSGRKSQVIAKPASRNARPEIEDPTARAIANVTQWQKDHGM